MNIGERISRDFNGRNADELAARYGLTRAAVAAEIRARAPYPLNDRDVAFIVAWAAKQREAFARLVAHLRAYPGGGVDIYIPKPRQRVNAPDRPRARRPSRRAPGK